MKIDFREYVLSELDKQKISRYQLAKMLKGVVAASTIYDWLSGFTRIADDKLAKICEVLKIKIK